MTRKKNPRQLTASAMITTIAVLALFFAGCDRGTVGIFASIEREEKTIQSNLPKDQTVTGFAEAAGAYFVAIGPRVWTRATTVAAADDTPWKILALRTDGAEYAASGVASSGNTVVTAYGSTIAVRNAADPSIELGSADFAGQIVTLLSAGDAVFVVENRSGLGHFFHYVDLTDPASPAITALNLPGSNPRVLGAAFHGTTYWFVTSDTVLNSPSPTTDPSVVAIAPGDNGGITNIGGIAVTAGGTVVVSSNSAGKVESSADGGTTWSESQVAADTGFPSVAVIGDTVYLGAQRGVYTLPASASGLTGTPVVETDQGYESAALRNASVIGGFFAASNDDGNDGIFILTNKGLWRRSGTGDSVSWIWE